MVDITVNLGNEYDDDLKNRLSAALRELNAKRLGNWFGIGGSQEITSGKFKINNHIIEIEIETYVGINVTGDDSVVLLIEKKVLTS